MDGTIDELKACLIPIARYLSGGATAGEGDSTIFIFRLRLVVFSLWEVFVVISIKFDN